MARYVKRRPPLRGGWDVGPEEFKALGFTVGLPPNLYVPQTQAIVELSQRFEACDSIFLDIDSDFYVKDRQFLFQDSRSIRCFVRDIPPGIDPDRLKRSINQKMYQKRLTTASECVDRVIINPNGQFAFVDFARSRDAERFIELKDSLEIDNHSIKIRRSHQESLADSPDVGVSEVRPERQSSLILWGIDKGITENDIIEIIGGSAKVSLVEIPRIEGASLGYAIVDLEDSSLTDLVALRLKYKEGIDCRRCFLRAAQQFPPPRDGSGQFLTLREEFEKMTVADVLNLDITLTTSTSNPSEVSEFRRLRIFNVMKSSSVSEIESVVEDMRQELARYGQTTAVFADMLADQTAPALGIPVVAIFTAPESAVSAQNGISGRKYRGRIVITMLEGGES
jgi:hypothetical protein